MPEVATVHLYWIGIPAALLPGILAAWWSRVIPADAAVLPEWQMAFVKKLSFTASLCTTVMAMVFGWSSLWLLPIECLGLSYSTHRVRRALLGESWPLHRYIAWRVQWVIGVFGFWAFVAFAPLIVVSVRAGALWWVAAACTVAAIAWLRFNCHVLLFALRATPLQRPDLDEAFQSVFERTSAVRPTLWRAGARGGVLANALALPALGPARVLFFDTLLEQLTADEIAAILAHEVAHLEYYNRQRLVRGYAAAYTVIAITILGCAGLATFGAGEWLAMVMPAVVFCALWARARRMQENETSSDLRAVELCGNAEALVSALTRIYAVNHIPRRVSLHSEQSATHPSLARRIRDIRAHALGGPPPRLSGRLVFSSTEEGRFAILDCDHVSFGWAASPLAGPDQDIARRASRIETLAYSELGELRLTTTKTGVTLTAVDHHARRWTVPLRQEDASAAQSALDVVDQLLGRPTVRGMQDWAYRLTALISLMCAWAVSASLSIVMPALLILARPTRPVMVGLAAALTAAALLSLGGVLQDTMLTLLLLSLAAQATWQARRPPTGHARGSHWTWIERVALAVPIVAGIAMIAVDGWVPFPLHVTLRDQPWFTASLLAATGYLSVSPLRVSRRLGAIAGVLAAAAIWVGSPWFLVHVAADPLIVEMPPLAERRVPLTWISQNTVEGEFGAVSLAPDGRHFLLSDYADEDYPDEEEAEPRRYTVGGFDGWSRQLRALDLAFVKSDQLLTLGHTSGGSELRTETLRGGDARWTLTIPGFAARSLTAGADGRWRALERRRKHLTRIEGTVGESDTVRTDWTIATGDMGYPVSDQIDDGNIGIAMGYRWSEPLIPWSSWNWRAETSILRLSADRTTPVASTHLTLNCVDPAIGVTGFVCIAFDGRWSRVWRVDAEAGRLIPLGQTRALVWSKAQTERNRISGMLGGRPMVLSLDTGTIDLFAADDDECLANDYALAGNLVATSCMLNGETIVKLYRIDAPVETSAP